MSAPYRSIDERDAREALAAFDLPGDFVDVRRLERGHIHDTFVSVWENGAGRRRFVHQCMNQRVFPDIDVLMGNIQRVSDHMRAKTRARGGHSDGFEPLRLIPTATGESHARLEHGDWRTFAFIENTSSFDRCSGPEQAYEAARAFGWFQAQLADLSASELGETLPRFFSSPYRYEQFESALAEATDERAASAAAEVGFARERRDMVHVIEGDLRAGRIAERVVHGDTKLNNILFDDDSGKARGIVDLDTCMPAYSLYDFGDLVRFTAATSAEDERDAALVGTDLELYRALADGYLSTAGAFLSDREVRLMPFAARLVTFTIGLRFLADHLAGDVYFKIHRPGHNLDRARVQFGMVDFMERNADAMRT